MKKLDQARTALSYAEIAVGSVAVVYTTSMITAGIVSEVKERRAKKNSNPILHLIP